MAEPRTESPAAPGGNRLAAGVLLAAMVAGVAAAAWVVFGLKPAAPADPLAPSAADRATIAAATEVLRGTMRDPDSMKVSHAYVRAGVVCGLYNARNGFGGYVGDRAFLVRDSAAMTAESSPPAFDVVFKAVCVSPDEPQPGTPPHPPAAR